MAFSIAPTGLHRPLGFELGDSGVVVGRAGGERPDALTGAAAVLHAPPDPEADACNRFSREQLRRSGGLASALVETRDGADAAAVARVAAEAARDLGVPLEQVLVAARPPGPPPPRAIASARGIVDGHRVSVLGLAQGRAVADGRGALRVALLTDTRLSPPALEILLHETRSRTLATLAGIEPPLPGDGVVALASGMAGASELAAGSLGFTTLRVGMVAMAQSLARGILERAHEPAAARLVQITVSGAASAADAVRACESLARDAAVRAAIAAADPAGALASGRAALGVFGLDPARARADLAARGDVSALRLDLRCGGAAATRWTSLELR